jgi:hypothetical protein
MLTEEASYQARTNRSGVIRCFLRQHDRRFYYLSFAKRSLKLVVVYFQPEAVGVLQINLLHAVGTRCCFTWL